jgi:hypothetical protein
VPQAERFPWTARCQGVSRSCSVCICFRMSSASSLSRASIVATGCPSRDGAVRCSRVTTFPMADPNSAPTRATSSAGIAGQFAQPSLGEARKLSELGARNRLGHETRCVTSVWRCECATGRTRRAQRLCPGRPGRRAGISVAVDDLIHPKSPSGAASGTTPRPSNIGGDAAPLGLGVRGRCAWATKMPALRPGPG